MPQATVKYAQGSPIDDWLVEMRKQGIEQSRAIRCALEAYLAQNGNNPPPPPTPASPAPGGGTIDYDRLGEAVYKATKRALSELQIAIPANSALNAEEAAPVAARDGLLDDIMAGLEQWASQ